MPLPNVIIGKKRYNFSLKSAIQFCTKLYPFLCCFFVPFPVLYLLKAFLGLGFNKFVIFFYLSLIYLFAALITH